jgi:hypothetical protein
MANTVSFRGIIQDIGDNNVKVSLSSGARTTIITSSNSLAIAPEFNGTPELLTFTASSGMSLERHDGSIIDGHSFDSFWNNKGKDSTGSSNQASMIGLTYTYS